MHWIADLTEDAMVATFLAAELPSAR